MPLTRIDVCKSRPPAEVQALMEAVYLAQRELRKIPENNRQIRYIEHRPEHFARPFGKSDNDTVVDVVMFPGRHLDTKRTLNQAIVRSL